MKIKSNSVWRPASGLLAAIICGVAWAGQSAISIDSQVDRSTIRLGDWLTYTVTVTRQPEVEVEMPGLGANLGAFEVRNYHVYDAEEADGTLIERVAYIITTFDVGEFEIPPLVFRYTLPGDSTAHELKTRPIKIVVESMKPSEAGDIRDIKDPLAMLRDWRKIVLWSSVALAVLVLAATLVYLWRRKKAGKGWFPEKVEPPRPAHELAFEALDALRASSLLDEGAVKEFYIRISEIIRRYIEGRYFIPALERTTGELVREMQAANVEPEDVERIQQFLQQCDRVKFAKYRPSAEETERAVGLAYEIVDRTKLIYEPASEASAGDESDEQAEAAAEGEDGRDTVVAGAET